MSTLTETDLRWDPETNDIVLDSKEPLERSEDVILNRDKTEVIEQSIEIAIRSSIHTRNMINAHPSDIKYLCILLRAEIKETHNYIIPDSVEVVFNPTNNHILFSATTKEDKAAITLEIDFVK